MRNSKRRRKVTGTERRGVLIARMQGLLSDSGFQNELAQIRAKALLQDLGEPETSPRWTYTAGRFCRNAAAAMYALEMSARENSETAFPHPDQARQLAWAWESLARLSEGVAQPLAQLNAALAYELAGYQANAACLAQSIGPAPEPDTRPDTQTLVALFLQRRLMATFQRAQYLLNHEPDPRLPLDELAFALADIVLADALSKACRFFLSGVREAYVEAEALLREAAGLFKQMGAPLETNMLYGLQSALPQMKRRSAWSWLEEQAERSEAWRRYLLLLARGPAGPDSRGITELWPTQIETLASGFLGSDDSVVVRLPASGGKTRLAEMAILDSFQRHPASKCAFIAPFRALAFEVERTLGAILNDLGYRVSSVLGAYEYDEVEAHLLQTADLLVVTPEKLDLLLRLRPEIAEQIRLVVLDEMHLIDDESRGIKLELLLSRMKARLRTCRFLVMSAVVPDSTLRAFAAWLADSPDRKVSSEWRPTIQRLARFEWRGSTGVIRFEEDTEMPDLKTFVPSAIRKREFSYLHPETRRQRTLRYPQTTKKDAAAELAYVFSAQGPVLVFCSQTNWVESVGQALLDQSIKYRQMTMEPVHSHFGSTETTRSSELARQWLGEEHIVTRALSRGIALHHGRLPQFVREAIEADCRAGRYRVIVATNTLAQGVNLPVKTVIMHSTRRMGEERRMIRIPVRDYWNIAGRAGRAGQETEGLVIHITLNEQDKRDFAYYKNPAHREPVRGALYRLLQGVVSARLSPEALEEVLATQDSGILAMAVEEGIEDVWAIQWQTLFERTFVSSQARAEACDMKPLLRSVQRVANHVFARAPETSWREVFAQTGLSSASCVALRTFSEGQADILPHLLQEAGLDDLPLLNRLALTACLPLAEADTDIIASFPGDAELLLGLWLEGSALPEISASLPEPPVAAETLSRFIEELFEYRLPWILSGLLRIAKALWDIPDDALSRYVRNYPSMVKYGASDPAAARAMAAGIASRRTALRLAHAYRQSHGNELSPDAFVIWLAELSDDALRLDHGITGHELPELRFKLRRMAPNDLLRPPLKPLRDILPRQTQVAGVVYDNRRIAARCVKAGDALDLQRDYGNPVDPNAISVHHEASQIGYLPRAFAQLLAPEVDAGQAIRAEAVSATPDEVPVVTIDLRLAQAV